MYYNSNKTNSDYYNTYKQEMLTLEDYHEEFSFQKIIKIGFTILMIGVVSISTIYLVNYFSTDAKKIETTRVQPQTKESHKLVISEETLPKSIQLKSKKINISTKDIALITEIILAQLKHNKESLEEQLISSQEDTRVKIKTLEESNHYNKVILSNITDNRDLTNKQIKIKEQLKTLLSNNKNISSYEKEIEKEINARYNEMRVIIVQEGDTLSKIAKKAYGTIGAYTKILTANPEIVKNPNEIFVGQRLRIPV